MKLNAERLKVYIFNCKTLQTYRVKQLYVRCRFSSKVRHVYAPKHNTGFSHAVITIMTTWLTIIGFCNIATRRFLFLSQFYVLKRFCC